ncbi:MAG TPA: ABC transporter ATP-binding protein [Ruminococcus sp.]
MLKVKNLDLSYKKDEQILHNVSLNVNPGEIVGLIGMNGAGKSTLMRAVSGVIPYQSGSITVNGKDIKKLTAQQRREISFLNAAHNLYSDMTVRDNMNIMRKFYKADEKSVQIAVKLLKCSDMLDKKTSVLSSGMRQRASIATSTLGSFRLLLLDEPTNALDIETKKYILDYIHYLSSEQNGILITSHNIKDIEELCDRIYVLRHGKIVKEATIESILRESAKKNHKWSISIPKTAQCRTIVEAYGKSEYSIETTEHSVNIIADEKIKQDILRKLVLDNIEIISVNSLVDNLEDAVLEIIGD